MNKAIRLVSMMMIALPLLSCGESAQKERATRLPESEKGTHGADMTAGDHGLSLDGTEKWQMDAHTRSMFTTMAASFDEGDVQSGDSGSIQATGGTIRRQIDELIQGCTMTGEAHDQLHKYLMVYIPAVEGMAKTGTKVEADRVRELLELYPRYFR